MAIGDLVRIISNDWIYRDLDVPSLGVIVDKAPDLYDEWIAGNPDWEHRNPCWFVFCYGKTYKFAEDDLEVINESR